MKNISTTSSIVTGLFCCSLITGISVLPVISTSVEPWTAKMYIAMAFCLITASTVWSIKVSHVWLLVYLIIHPLLISGLDFGNVVNNTVHRMAAYYPTMQALCYALFFWAISSTKIDSEQFRVWAERLAVILASYAVLQFFWLDQWQAISNNVNAIHTDGWRVTATLGHPNQLGIFLACLLPFCRKWWSVLLTVASIIATESIMAYAGVFVVIMSLVYRFNKKACCIICGLVIVFAVAVLFNKPGIGSGRIDIWLSSIKAMGDGRINILTGYGFGSFKYLVGRNMNALYMQNEILQIIFEIGLIGIFLIFCLIKSVFNNKIILEKDYPFIISGIVLLVCSLGSFTFQVEPLRYMAVFLLGYFNSKGEKNEKVVFNGDGVFYRCYASTCGKIKGWISEQRKLP